MQLEIVPIAVRPSLLNGLSEQMVVGHYENTYGNAVRMLNDVRRELAALGADTPPYRLRGLKRMNMGLEGDDHERAQVSSGDDVRRGPKHPFDCEARGNAVR
jgi:hypothetical protein